MDFLLGYWHFFFNLWTWVQILVSKPITQSTCVYLTFPLPKQFIFPSLSSLTVALSSHLFVVLFVFHCHRWRAGAWKTGKYWILFYPLDTCSNWFLFHWGEVLKLERLAAVCSSWSLLTVSVSGNHLLQLGNVKWLQQFLLRKYSFP